MVGNIVQANSVPREQYSKKGMCRLLLQPKLPLVPYSKLKFPQCIGV